MILRYLSLTGILLLPLSGFGAVITVSPNSSHNTPELLGYNLGHYFPGSNTSDWLRFSKVSGIRIFLSPAHFNVSATHRPGEAEVTSFSAFRARRDALRADPLNEAFINWPVIESRFNTPLSGNNRIHPEYALREINRLGLDIKAQMTLGASAFPIEDEEDWPAIWIAWRTYYSIAFYLAREFGVERFAAFNEPNHSASFIEPEPWLWRLRIASDAAQSALADVNELYGKNLRPQVLGPITAGGIGGAFDSYGLPSLEGIADNTLEADIPNFQLFHRYAYQRYNFTPAEFSGELNQLGNAVAEALPENLSTLPFSLTEFNVHTGATYDSIPESSDSLEKALRLGAISSRLTQAGARELYAFKFGMTRYNGNFPVQKNGMLFTDNDNEPHNYGGMTRSAQAFRLFTKGFAPGRQLLDHTLTGTGASSLQSLVAHDPAADMLYLYLVNETGSSIPIDIDLVALGIPEGNAAIIEDVSQWRNGVIRSIETVTNGRLTPGNQPARTVWLITLPMTFQERQADESPFLTLPATQEVMVRDGLHAETNFIQQPTAFVRNDPASPDGRSAAFLQFELPDDWHPENVLLALLSVPIAPGSGQTNPVHTHLYGIDHHDWEETSLTWASAPNLRQNAPVGSEIAQGVLQGAGSTAHILGELSTSGPTVRSVEVTDYLVRQVGGKASFLILQDPRWDVDIRVDEIPEAWDSLPRGDIQSDGLEVLTRRSSGGPANGAQLILVRRPIATESYDRWAQRVFPRKELIAEPFAYTDGPLAGQGPWDRGPSSPPSDNPSNHLVVAGGAVRFDWTTLAPISNLVRLLWPAAQVVTDHWIYASFDLMVEEAPRHEANLRPGFLSFGDESGNQQRGFVGISAGQTAGSFRLGISSRSQLGSAFVYAPRDLNSGETYRITMGLNAASEDTALWIDSDPRTAPAALTVAGSGTNNGINRINLRMFNTNGSDGTTNLGIFTLDNLHISLPDPDLANPAADLTGDGMANKLKFALGLDPLSPEQGNGPRLERAGESFFLSFPRNLQARGVRLAVEQSHNLTEWHPHSGELEVIVRGLQQRVRIALENKPTNEPTFLRLRATAE